MCPWCGFLTGWDPDGDELCGGCNEVLSRRPELESWKEGEITRLALVKRMAHGIERVADAIEELVKRGREQ